MIKINKLYLDFDCTIVNTIEKVVELYNIDYAKSDSYKPVHWTEISTWGFSELPLANNNVIDKYFSDERFFSNLKYMDNALEIINKLKANYDIYCVSMGTNVNLFLKNMWLKLNLPFIKLIGVDIDTNIDKRCLDLSDGILIDDVSKNLYTSNAKENICFGDIYTWNEDWIGTRCFNWYEVEQHLNQNK
jgi:5'(3')-deoxyribonucleotidase